MKTMKKLLAVFLCAAMLMSMAATVMAEDETTQPEKLPTIDTAKKGSLTIHKYDGSEGDTSTPLSGVEFTVYQVMNQENLLEYYNGTSTETVNVDKYLKDGTIDANQVIDSSSAKITDSAGIAKFENLSLGMYVVIETDYPDKVTSPVAPFLVSVPMTNKDGDDWLYDVDVYPKNSTSLADVILKKTDSETTPLEGVKFDLYKKDASGKYVKPAAKASYATDANGEIKVDDLTVGEYYLVETETLAGYIVDDNPVYFKVEEGNKITYDRSDITSEDISYETTDAGNELTITLKNEKPDVTKEVYNGTDWTDETQTSIGGTVKYRISVSVPKNISSLKTFTITDAPEHLTDDIGTVKVWVGDENRTEISVKDKVQLSGNGFKIEFNQYNAASGSITSALTGCAGKTITIEYDATLLSSAVASGNVNTVDLEYSNKVGINSDGTYHIKDKAVVYTYGINITKYGGSAAEGKELSGVQFELYQGDGGDPLTVVGSNGVYRLAVSGDSGTTTTLETADGTDTGAAKGQIVVTGLANGTYYLKETKTVEDYNLLKDRIALTLSIDTATEWTTSGEFKDDTLAKKAGYTTTYKNGDSGLTDGFVAQTIINKKGFTLPVTGAMGTLLFSVIGCMLMLGGVLVLMRSGKKNAHK